MERKGSKEYWWKAKVQVTKAAFKGLHLLSRGYTSDFLLAMVMRFFLKIVASPARGENRMCSHPRTVVPK